MVGVPFPAASTQDNRPKSLVCLGALWKPCAGRESVTGPAVIGVFVSWANELAGLTHRYLINIDHDLQEFFFLPFSCRCICSGLNGRDRGISLFFGVDVGGAAFAFGTAAAEKTSGKIGRTDDMWICVAVVL